MNNSLPSNWFQLSDTERFILTKERQIMTYQERIDRGHLKYVPLVEKMKQEIQDWKKELENS